MLLLTSSSSVPLSFLVLTCSTSSLLSLSYISSRPPPAADEEVRQERRPCAQQKGAGWPTQDASAALLQDEDLPMLRLSRRISASWRVLLYT
eukprot:897219-Rhodomonas_salina.2